MPATIALATVSEALHYTAVEARQSRESTALSVPARLRSSVLIMGISALFLATPIVLAAPAGAQLLSERVQDTTRVCTYVGNDTLPDGESVPRTLTVGLGQSCPALAPYHDPNAPTPPNATFRGERTTSDHRVCLYTEAGVSYEVSVPLTRRCAQTPALLQQTLATPDEEQE